MHRANDKTNKWCFTLLFRSSLPVAIGAVSFWFEILWTPYLLPKLDNHSACGKISLGVVTHSQDNSQLNMCHMHI